jgi:hypothetical protein
VHCPPNKRETKLSIKQCKWPVLVHCLPKKRETKLSIKHSVAAGT